MKIIATIDVSQFAARYEQNLNDAFTWQIGVISAFMSVIAVAALMSFILNKS